jgi:hypothetical protein
MTNDPVFTNDKDLQKYVDNRLKMERKRLVREIRKRAETMDEDYTDGLWIRRQNLISYLDELGSGVRKDV